MDDLAEVCGFRSVDLAVGGPHFGERGELCNAQVSGRRFELVLVAAVDGRLDVALCIQTLLITGRELVIGQSCFELKPLAVELTKQVIRILNVGVWYIP